MNKTLKIILFVLLALSVIANGFLGFQMIQKNKSIDEFTRKLMDSTTELEVTKSLVFQTQEQLTVSQGELQQVEAELVSQKDTNNTLSQQVVSLTNDNNSLNQKLNGFMCQTVLSTEQVGAAASNESLIDPIARALEQLYGGGMVYQGYIFFWNNSKDAWFTYLDQQQKGKIVAVVWDFNAGNLGAIYNLNDNCFIYSVRR